MDTLLNTYRDDDDDSDTPLPIPNSTTYPSPDTLTQLDSLPTKPDPEPEPKPEPMAIDDDKTQIETPTVELTEQEVVVVGKVETVGSEDVSSGSISEIAENEEEEEEEEESEDGPALKKQKSEDPIATTPQTTTPLVGITNGKKSAASSSKKKKSHKANSVWTKPTSRKGKKKAKNFNAAPPKPEETVMVTPVPRFPDKNDDSPEAKICLSKVYKAEKVEVSEDRMSAGSCKGYRMVRATRGVSEGAWYFEIKVVHLGETGHTRLGWSLEKGDLQAPVGYDGSSFGYRDIDGSKIHKALREKYGEEGYKEGDVVGFYINLPEGDLYAPKPPSLVWYKGQKYACNDDRKEETPKIVPGSEISFFKNGVCQGVAFKDLFGGRYYPAASMYTLPNEPNCVVKFNFGPDFECYPADFEGRPVPRPMIEVPYYGYDNRVENDVSNENKE